MTYIYNKESDDLKDFLTSLCSHSLLSPEQELLLARQVQIMLKIKNKGIELSFREPFSEDMYEELSLTLKIPRANLIVDYDKGTLAREVMIKHNMRLVVSIAKNFTGRGIELKDLIQEGCFGLIKGIEKYDPNRGTKLSTYATFWIGQAIKRAICEKSRTIRLPIHVLELQTKIRKTKHKLRTELGKEPNDMEIISDLKIKGENVSIPKYRLVTNSERLVISLESELSNKKDGTTITLSEFIADKHIHDLSNDNQRHNSLNEELSEVLNELPQLERDVLILRFGLDGQNNGEKRSFDQVGIALGITRDKARTMVHNAIIALRSNKDTIERLIDYAKE